MLLAFMLSMFAKSGGDQVGYWMVGSAFISVTSILGSIFVSIFYQKSAREHWYLLALVVLFSLPLTYSILSSTYYQYSLISP